MENCSHPFLTASRTRFHLSQRQNLSVGIVLAMISFFTVLVNSFLIFLFLKTKQLTNSTNVYITFLSLSDCLLIGAVTLPSESVLHIVYHDKQNCILSNFVLAFSNFSTKLSGYFILLIGFHRFMNITTEFKKDNYLLKKLKSKCGSVILTFLCLIFSIVQGGIVLLSNKYTVPGIFLRILDLIAVIIVYTLYIRVYLEVRRHCKGSVVHRKEGGRVHISGKNTGGLRTSDGKSDCVPRYMKRLTETVLLILTNIAICYLPYLVVSIWRSSVAFHKVSNTLHILHTLALLLAYLNSSLNACIILYRNKKTRRYLSRKASHAIFGSADSQKPFDSLVGRFKKH